MPDVFVTATASNADPNHVGAKGSITTPYGLQAAFDNVAAGDRIIICADAVYNVGTQIDIDTTAATAASPIIVTGANASGTIDGSNAHLKAMAAITYILQTAAAFVNYAVSYLELDGNGQATYCAGTTTFSTAIIGNVWRNCRFHGAVADGVRHRSGGMIFVSCESDHNGGHGLYAWISGASFNAVQRCLLHHNSGDGLRLDGITSIVMANNLVFANGGDGAHIALNASARTDQIVVVSNTFDGNGGDAVEFTTSDLGGRMVMRRNALTNNGAYGLNLNTLNYSTATIDHNAGYANISGNSNLAGNALPGLGNVTGDPLYASRTPGSEDYTPQAGSTLYINAGIDGRTIGAIEAVEMGAGGGTDETYADGKRVA